MKKITDYSHPVQFLIYSGILLGLASLIPLTTYLTTAQTNKISKEEREERSRMDFCKMVLDVVKPDDKMCGKYLARIRKEIKDEEAAAASKEAAQRAAAEHAADPARTLTEEEMVNCQVRLRNSARDPSSVEMHRKTPTAGGLIDFTATNGFGGPTRGVFHCATGQVIQEN